MSASDGGEQHADLWVADLGVLPYEQAATLQERLRGLRLAEEIPDTLLLLEHPPVYTRGRRSRDQELTLGEDFYRGRGIEVCQTRRGGRVTYHAPGQLVGYAIMKVHDLGAHLRLMESAIIEALAGEGLTARSRCAEGPDYTGVWVQDRKIASIGVHVSRSVATHGFAVNVENDLEPFSWVIACGLAGVKMTSLAAELGESLAPPPGLLERFRAEIAESFARAYGLRGEAVEPQRLGIDRAHAARPHARIAA